MGRDFGLASTWKKLERETGLEPATNSLEGCDSSQLSYSRIATHRLYAAQESLSMPIAQRSQQNYCIHAILMTCSRFTVLT